MRHLELEKKVKKLDREIEALKIAKKYLSNVDEIESVREKLNNERTEVANELYFDDSRSLFEVKDLIKELKNIELGKDEQKKLLEDIKEIYGRQSPNASKEANGLTAWLKKVEANFEWKENPGSEWAILIIR